MTTRLITPLLLLTACSVQKIDKEPTPTTRTARVELVHMAADLGPVDVFGADSPVPFVRGLAYEDGPYAIDVAAGRISLDVTINGQRLRTINLNVEADHAYSAVVLSDREVVLEAAPTPDDATYVRLTHAADDVGAIDLWDIDAGTQIAEGLTFGEATPATIASQRIGIDVDADGAADLIYDLGELPSRTVVDVFAVEQDDTVVLRSFTSEGTSQSTMPQTAPIEPARIRVLHLAPDAPNVDVYANQTIAVENLEFTRGTGFLEVPPDAYTFDITAAGSPDAVISADLDLDEGVAFTAVAFDTLANLSVLALPESLEPVTEGARIRIVHAAAGVGDVDVLDADTNAILLDDVAFGTASPQFAAPAGVHSFGLDLDDDNTPEFVFDVPELPDGASANIFAVTDAQGAFLLVQLFDGTTIRVRPRHVPAPTPTANVRALHLSPDATPVNLFVDADPNAAVTGLEFENGTDYLELDAGAIDLSVSLGTLADAFLGPLALELVADANYTAVVFDNAATAQALVLEDDLSAPAVGNIRIRAIHTAVGVGNVNILAGGGPLYEDVPFGVAGAAIEVPAGTYVIGIDVDDDHHADLEFALPSLAEGTIANVFAVADAHGTVELLVQFADSTVAVIDALH